MDWGRREKSSEMNVEIANEKMEKAIHLSPNHSSRIFSRLFRKVIMTGARGNASFARNEIVHLTESRASHTR